MILLRILMALLVGPAAAAVVRIECMTQRQKVEVKFTQCAISNFSNHYPISSQIDKLHFLGAKVNDIDGCVSWLQNLPPILREFIIRPASQEATEGLAECLSKLSRPIRFGANVTEVSLEGLQPIDETWLNQYGYLIFSDLANKSVGHLSVTEQNLLTANTSAYLSGIRVTGQFHLMTHHINVIKSNAFSHLDVSSVNTLCLKYNQVCVLPMLALRNMTKLRVIHLQGNPLYVPWKVFIEWKSKYPDSILISLAPDCEKFVGNYTKCPAWEVEHFIDEKRDLSLEIHLVDRLCRPKFSASLKAQSLPAWAIVILVCASVLVTVGLAFGVKHLWTMSVNYQLKHVKALEEAVAIQRLQRDERKLSQLSEVYDEVQESTYNEIDELEESHGNDYSVAIRVSQTYDVANCPNRQSSINARSTDTNTNHSESTRHPNDYKTIADATAGQEL